MYRRVERVDPRARNAARIAIATSAERSGLRLGHRHREDRDLPAGVGHVEVRVVR